MSPPSNPRVLLIDLENCPNQIKRLPEDLESFFQVVICYAQNAPKIPLDWLTSLVTAVNHGRLTILKVENGNKNAADFSICFFAGILMQRLPEDTHFLIASNDTDLDHVVRLLISQGRSAERMGMVKEQTHIATDDIAALIKAYCVHLVTHSKTRPANETTLFNSIKSKFQCTPSIASDVLAGLLKHAVISTTTGKITYNDININVLATPNEVGS